MKTTNIPTSFDELADAHPELRVLVINMFESTQPQFWLDQLVAKIYILGRESAINECVALFKNVPWPARDVQ
jgi:hypothetical protein